MELLSTDAHSYFSYITTIMSWGNKELLKDFIENLTLKQLTLLQSNNKYKKILKGCVGASKNTICLETDKDYRYVTWIGELELIVLHSKTTSVEGNSITFDTLNRIIRGSPCLLIDIALMRYDGVKLSRWEDCLDYSIEKEDDDGILEMDYIESVIRHIMKN